MKLTKKIAAAALSGCMALASVPVVLPVTAYAADTAISKYYDSKDIVWDEDSSLFLCVGETTPNEKFLKVLQNATGRRDYALITFGDLEKITSLNASGIGLEGVPRIIEYMTRLRSLNLSKNKLRSSTVTNIDLSDCYQLSTLDISYNFLTSVPAWYTASTATNKNISYNLINTTNQRNLVVSPNVYYFGLEDSLTDKELAAFKDKVLSTVKLNDGSLLPEYFYDPLLSKYDIPEDPGKGYLTNDNIDFDIDVSAYVTNGVVKKAGSVKGTVSLFVPGASNNPKIQAEVTVYFLDGNDPSTIKFRLESLIAECEKLNADTYTTPTWTVFSNQLKTAKAIYQYSNTDQEMLKNALDSLTEAKKQLVEGVNTNTKKILTDLLAIAKTYKEADYTAESWRKLTNAINLLTDASENKSTSLDDANAAIKAFQDAQNALTATKQEKPAIITKAEFEAIYGDNKTVTAKGATKDGCKYSWKFTGTDITKPADFDPEVKYESKNEEAIRFEAGSASDYQLISFAEEKAFPGTGELTLDVSKVYKNGVYRLYKYNTSTKKSEFVREVTVEDGSVTTSFSEGGDYFISSVLQNFQMISSNFDINHDKRTITAKFKQVYTVADFRNNIENGSAVNITKADGSAVTETQRIATGMLASAPNSDASYTLIVIGDIDGDGYVTALDVVYILRALTGEITMDTYASKAAGDVNGDGYVRANDASVILKYIVGVE